MHAKSFQSCPTLHDLKDFSLLGSAVHGILQARILDWVAIPLRDLQSEDWSSGLNCALAGTAAVYIEYLCKLPAQN